jgi:hypothetical protein
MLKKSHTLLTLGTKSCSALILSAILSLRNCNKLKLIRNTNVKHNSQKLVYIHANIQKLTLSAMLCGSVACPLLARTLGRMAGGCGAAGTLVCMGCP